MCPTKALASVTSRCVTPLASARSPISMKNGIAISTKWLMPCHMLVGSVDQGIESGASTSPTIVEASRTMPIGTRNTNRTRKTARTTTIGGMYQTSRSRLDCIGSLRKRR